jgi:polyferredoxin
MIARLLSTALLLLLPAAASAHGEHGDARPVNGTSAVTVQGYRIELMSHPSPPAVGETTHFVAKIVGAASGMPVSGGHVLIGIGAPGAKPELMHAHEMTWAGSYEAAVTPSRLGPQHARVLIAGLDARRFEPALTVEFPVTVGRTPGFGAAAWTMLALVAVIAVVAVYAARLRSSLGAPGAGALNLLDVPWLRRLLTSSALQPSLQVPLLGLMGIVVLLGFADVQDGGVNFATRLTWTIWWAGIIFTFVLVGRVWCLACPFGALNEWASRLAAPLRRLPAPFRNLWWATAMFVLLTWADEQLGVVRSPRVTAWIVLFFTAFAIAVGLVYERRSFCRYLCPIGGLIGIYAMTAPVELRTKDGAACRKHHQKECYRGTAASRGCPMFEFPQTMDRNNYCTLCAECVKGCSRDNLVLRFRAFGKDLWASGRRALDESYLAVALVGLTLIVTAEMLTGWADWTGAVARWLPGWVRGTFKPVTYLGFVESALLLGGSLVVVPMLVLGGAAVADRLAGEGRLGVRRTFVLFGYMFVPIGLGMHLAHNLAHLLLEGGGIVPAAQRAVALYTPFSLGEPDWQLAMAPAAVVSLLQMAVLVAFFVLSLVAGHRLTRRAYPDGRSAARALVPMVALSFAFTAAGIVLLNLPMGMRHG